MFLRQSHFLVSEVGRQIYLEGNFPPSALELVIALPIRQFFLCTCQVIKTLLRLDKPCQAGNLLQMGDWSNKQLPTSHNLTPMTIVFSLETTKTLDSENAEYHGHKLISQWNYQWWCRWKKQAKIWLCLPGVLKWATGWMWWKWEIAGRCRGLSQKGNWERGSLPTTEVSSFQCTVCGNTF